jgi:hypothetical protein
MRSAFPLPRNLGALIALLILAVLPAMANATSGTPQPPTNYLSSFSTWPPEPNALEPLSLTMFGAYPYGCGYLAFAAVMSPDHIAIHLTQQAPCPDTSRISHWDQSLGLGTPTVGHHDIHVALTVDGDPLYGGATHVYDEVIAIDVAAEPPPPPAPTPHEYGSWLLRGLSGYSTQPASPTYVEPTTLILWGWAPYFCGQVSNAQVIDAGHVTLTIEPGPACSDTTQTWSQSFALGMLPVGPHTVHIDLTIVGDDSSYQYPRQASFDFWVSDTVSSPPPPPPPPIDSLTTSHPNPFAEETQFSVVMTRDAMGEVSIFDVSGRKVALLHRGLLTEGKHDFTWNGRRDDGTSVQRGLYFYRLATPGRVVTRKVVLTAGI